MKTLPAQKSVSRTPFVVLRFPNKRVDYAQAESHSESISILAQNISTNCALAWRRNLRPAKRWNSEYSLSSSNSSSLKYVRFGGREATKLIYRTDFKSSSLRIGRPCASLLKHTNPCSTTHGSMDGTASFIWMLGRIEFNEHPPEKRVQKIVPKFFF